VSQRLEDRGKWKGGKVNGFQKSDVGGRKWKGGKVNGFQKSDVGGRKKKMTNDKLKMKNQW